MNVRFNDVVIKSQRSSFDDRQVAYLEKYDTCLGQLSWWMSYEDGDEFMFADILICEEIQVMFITDYYGFNFHNYDECVEYRPALRSEQPQVEENLQEMKNILKKMYPTYTVYLYNKGLYKKLQAEMLDMRRYQSIALHKWLPFDIRENIYGRMVPRWTQFQHKKWKQRWTHHSHYRNHYETAQHLFFQNWAALEEMNVLTRNPWEFVGKLAKVSMGR